MSFVELFVLFVTFNDFHDFPITKSIEIFTRTNVCTPIPHTYLEIQDLRQSTVSEK